MRCKKNATENLESYVTTVLLAVTFIRILGISDKISDKPEHVFVKLFTWISADLPEVAAPVLRYNIAAQNLAFVRFFLERFTFLPEI